MACVPELLTIKWKKNVLDIIASGLHSKIICLYSQLIPATKTEHLQFYTHSLQTHRIEYSPGLKEKQTPMRYDPLYPLSYL